MTITSSPAVPNAALAADILAALGVPARESFAVHAPDNAFEPGRVVGYDALQFAGHGPVEALSDHALRCPEPGRTPPDDFRRFLAPDVRSDKHGFVEYALYHYTDHPRAGADFPTLRHPSYQLVTQRLANRGLALEVDEEAEPLDGDWPLGKVAFLRGVIDRARLRRTVGLFVAGAVSVHKTWSVPPSDPDRDISDELAAQTLRASRVLYGPGAWARRARHVPGGDASAPGSLENLANEFAVEEVRVIGAEDAADAAGLPRGGGGQVLLFCAADHLGRHDFSNLKTFTAPAKTGERYAAYLRRIGGKRWRVAVECYETVAITSTVGLEVVTVD